MIQNTHAENKIESFAAHDSLLIKYDSALNVCIIVAHPDDETLWVGGLILMNPEWNCFIFSLCRADDQDRAPKFKRVLSFLGASGSMANMNDGPEQHPLSQHAVQHTIMSGIESPSFDVVISHGPKGEYTRHRRHEEVSQAVLELVQGGKIHCKELWQFAYKDGDGQYAPRAMSHPSYTLPLPDAIWTQKVKIITEIYGFAPESWEARITPRTEAFQIINSAPSNQSGKLAKEK
jgi:LmbE family N-acetylglucosaminyl deacetylase